MEFCITKLLVNTPAPLLALAQEAPWPSKPIGTITIFSDKLQTFLKKPASSLLISLRSSAFRGADAP